MPLTRLYEEEEVSPDLRRIFSDIRTSLDLPFVPSVFKLAAAHPRYLKLMWDDLGPVARSREFQSASRAMEEFVRSLVIAHGWKMSDQQRVLANQKFSYNDIEQLGTIVSTFNRARARMLLFSRLMQRGCAGGQRGRVTASKQASALARLVTVHVPNEGEAGLRVWLIYSDIRRTTGSKTVLSIYRALAPFPGYLASVWMDSKKLLNEPGVKLASEQVVHRADGLVIGLPVKDHRALGKEITAAQWREIQELTDEVVKMQPQFALIGSIWQRSFRITDSTAVA